MEPRDKPESPKASEQQGKEKKRRFQIVKLEERIAPDKGGKGTHNCGGSGTGGCSSTSTESFGGGIF